MWGGFRCEHERSARCTDAMRWASLRGGGERVIESVHFVALKGKLLREDTMTTNKALSVSNKQTVKIRHDRLFRQL